MKAIVTGISAGIGGAICLEIARNTEAIGSKIALFAERSTTYLDSLVAELRNMNCEATLHYGDLKDEAAPARLVGEALKAMGGLDALISNAGIVDPGPLLDLTLDRFDHMMHINTYPTLLLAQAAHSALKESRGSIVAISSIAGLMPSRGTAAYGPCKAALSMLVRQLALEWADDGIRANVVSPGLIRTPINESVFKDESVTRKRLELIPVHTIGLPSDVARAVWYFASPENRYSTAMDITVDGGLTASISNHIPGTAPKAAECGDNRSCAPSSAAW